MKKKHLWLSKVMAAALCAAMAAEPAVIYAEDFSDGFYSENQENQSNQESQENSSGFEESSTKGDLEQVNENTDAGKETEDGSIDRDTPDTVPEPNENENSSENDSQINSTPEASWTESDPDLLLKDNNGELDLSDFSSGDSTEIITDEEGFFGADEEEGETDGLTEADASGGKCGANVTWSLENGVLTIEGTGNMYDFVVEGDEDTELKDGVVLQPWENYAYSINEVVVKDGVSLIGYAAFSNLPRLTKAVFSDSVQYVGPLVFANDNALTEISLGNNMKEIYYGAFYGTAIRNLVLPSTVTYLNPGNSLLGMPLLQNIQVNGNGKYISKDGVLYADGGKTLFQYPAGRTGSYKIPGDVTKIEMAAFAYSSLSSVEIPGNVKTLGTYTFMNAGNLTSLTVAAGVDTIPEGFASGAEKLSKVTLANGITTIGSEAFSGCQSLASITLPSSLNQIASDAFGSNTKITFQNAGIHQQEDGTIVAGVKVGVTGTENYKYAFEVLTLVNKERKKVGAAPLTMEKSLLETAMLRSYECALYFDHTRPSGSDCFTANSLMSGENIAAGQTSPSSVVKGWMNSTGHRQNILNASFKTIGIGCVNVNGVYLWVQCFGTGGGSTANASSYSNKTSTRKVLTASGLVSQAASFSLAKTSLKVGETTTFKTIWGGTELKNSGAIAVSSDNSVCTVQNGKIKAVKAGKAKITMYFDGYKAKSVTKTITVTGGKTKKVKAPAKGKLNRLTNKKGKKCLVSIKKISGAAGYQVSYATNSKFSGAKKKTTSKTSLILSGLKKNKTYYVKVRAYKKDSKGKKVYGSYSAAKKIKIKK